MKSDLTVIYTDIGRGHPNYLDSVLRHLRLNHPVEFSGVSVFSVLSVSQGLSLAGWKAVQTAYRVGARGGLLSSLYSKARSRKAAYSGNSALERLLRRDLMRRLSDRETDCLVAHPLLASMLGDHHRVLYLHGEIAAPRESAVPKAERVYVPLPETHERMQSMGVPQDALLQTGLVLEPELCIDRDETARKRIERLQSNQPLTAGFFISGAYPAQHVKMIALAATSCLAAEFDVRLFWGIDPRELRRLLQLLGDVGHEAIFDDATAKEIPDGRLIVVTAKTREAETQRSLSYLPLLDVFCAAPHERVNWAVGAGLPMIMITPTIGSFAAENCAFVLQRGCGVEFNQRRQFAEFARELQTLRSQSQLSRIAEAGSRITEIHGAQRIAEDLLHRIDLSMNLR
jgi:hypothetical protein